MRSLKPLIYCLAFALVLACGVESGEITIPQVAEAADADLQQYNRPAANAEAANAASALTSALLLPSDGKLITADANSAGKAPVNRSLKELGDMIAGVRCMILGNCASVNRRTVKALEVDASGGLVSTSPDGTIKVGGATASGTSAPTTSVAAGTIYRDSVPLCWARGYWNGAAMVLTRGFNVRPLVRNSQGDYTVTCNSALTAPASAIASLTMGVNPSVVAHGFVGNVVQITDDGSSRPAVEFITTDPNAGTLLDTSAISPFFIEIKGY